MVWHSRSRKTPQGIVPKLNAQINQSLASNALKTRPGNEGAIAFQKAGDNMPTYFNFKSLAAGVVLATASASWAQTVPIFGLDELSGTGATSGSNFDNGIKLAVREINAAGGILGRKIAYQSLDMQSNPGVAKALAQKAVDESA